MTKTYKLEDLVTMTKYQIVKVARTHLLKQNERSTLGRVNSTCKYRTISKTTGKPLMCGVGVFISDAEYDPKMEGMRADGLLKKFAEATYNNIGDEKLELLHKIQFIHDYIELDNWEGRLNDIMPLRKRT